jgi:hypothetical protein
LAGLAETDLFGRHQRVCKVAVGIGVLPGGELDHAQ